MEKPKKYRMQTQSLQPVIRATPRRQAILLALVFLGLWGLRLATLHPAFHPDDSPEIVAAAAGLGIPHPPGYPLYTLLGRLAVLALPGGPALAVNGLAALLGCLGVLLGAWLGLRALADPDKPSLAWALALFAGMATLPQLWFQGQSAKGGIYTLNLVLTLGALLLMQPPAEPSASEGQRVAKLRLAWLLVGLGLANHYMSFVLFGPALAWWSWQAQPGLRRQLKLWAWALPGLALYLYLPVRALHDPAMNWGDPSSLARLWTVLTRAQYSGAESGQDLGNALHLARHFDGLWAAQWGRAAWALLLLGALALFRQGRRWRPLLACLALHLAVVLAYNHPPRSAPWVINAFFLPTFVLAAPLLLAGALRLGPLLKLNAKASLALATAALLLALAAAPARYRANDYHRDYLLYDYGNDLLLLPRPNAAILASGGNDAFTVWFLQQLEHKRPDLTLVDIPLVSDWYLAQLRPRLPELDPSWRSRDQVSQGLLAYPRRPLYYTSHNPGDRGIPLGLLAYVPQPGQPITLSTAGLLGPWAATRLRWVADDVTPMDGNREELLGYFPDSMKALKEFAQRQGAGSLVMTATGWERRFKMVTALPQHQ